LFTRFSICSFSLSVTGTAGGGRGLGGDGGGGGGGGREGDGFCLQLPVTSPQEYEQLAINGMSTVHESEQYFEEQERTHRPFLKGHTRGPAKNEPQIENK